MKAAAVPASDVHALALAAAEVLIGQLDTSPESSPPIRELVRACYQDLDKANRLKALHLSRRPSLELTNAAVVLLNDPDADVRAGAMLTVGTSDTAICTDDLLHWLHDPDPEVRRLCEKALRTRGLPDAHLRLGRIVSDAHAESRLQVFELLKETSDLDEGVWLRRLSHDASPAVRAAAVRAAGEQGLMSLSDRLQQMSQNDPSPTVRQLAQFYGGPSH
jgi:HEAT repeat protein